MNRRQLSSERIIKIIEEEWAKTRLSGSVGTTKSKIVYDKLVAEGVDVPKRAMAQVLEALWNEGFIEGELYRNNSDVPTHRTSRPIIESKWHAELLRKSKG
jgi:hypothetical protein